MERQKKIYSPSSDRFLKESRSTAGSAHLDLLWLVGMSTARAVSSQTTSWPSSSLPQRIVHHRPCACTDIRLRLSVFTHCLLSLSLYIQEPSPLSSDVLVYQFRIGSLPLCDWIQTLAHPGPWGSFWSGSCQFPRGRWLESQGQQCPGGEPPTGSVWPPTDSAALQNNPGSCGGAHNAGLMNTHGSGVLINVGFRYGLCCVCIYLVKDMSQTESVNN